MTQRRPSTVLIVDDHPLLRDAVETALTKASHGAARALHAGSLGAALEIAADEAVDLVLLDLKLSDVCDFEGLLKLQTRKPGLAVAIVSASDAAETIARARRLGARAFLPKRLELDEMARAIAVVLDGGTWFPEHAPTADADIDPADRLCELTPAQRRVLDGLSGGLLNKQIAYEMGISQATVKAHMTAIFRKLGVNNRTQALLALKAGAALGQGADG